MNLEADDEASFCRAWKRQRDEYMIERLIFFGAVLSCGLLTVNLFLPVRNRELMIGFHAAMAVVFILGIFVRTSWRNHLILVGELLGFLAYTINAHLVLANDPAATQFVASAVMCAVALGMGTIIYSPLDGWRRTLYSVFAMAALILAFTVHPLGDRLLLVSCMAILFAETYIRVSEVRIRKVARLEFQTRSLAREEEAKLEAAAKVLQSELDLAATVQALLVADFAELDQAHFAVSGYFRPAGRLSGDWLWYHRRSPDHLVILLGDVTGHGAESALFAAIVAGAYRAVEHAGKDLPMPEVLKLLNETLMTVPTHRRATVLSVIELDGTAVRWHAAGAPPVFVCRADGSLQHFSKPSAPIGDEDFEPLQRDVELAPGDRLLVFSDGLSELRNAAGKELGLSETKRWLASVDKAPLLEARAALGRKIDERTGGEPLDDDLTFVLVERKGRVA